MRLLARLEQQDDRAWQLRLPSLQYLCSCGSRQESPSITKQSRTAPLGTSQKHAALEPVRPVPIVSLLMVSRVADSDTNFELHHRLNLLLMARRRRCACILAVGPHPPGAWPCGCHGRRRAFCPGARSCTPCPPPPAVAIGGICAKRFRCAPARPDLLQTTPPSHQNGNSDPPCRHVDVGEQLDHSGSIQNQPAA